MSPRPELMLRCMRCDKDFKYLIAGVDVGIENKAEFYETKFSVCNKCTEKLSEQYALKKQ